MGKTSGASEYARPDVQVQISEVDGQPEAEPGGTPDAAPPRRARTLPNPYFLAAWVLSVGMTGIGVLLMFLIRHQLLNPPTFADFSDPYSSGTVVVDPATGAFQGMASTLFLPTPEVSALASQLVIAGLVGATLLLIVHGVLHRVPRSPAARS